MSNEGDMTIVTFRCSSVILAQIKEVCERTGESRIEVVRSCIARFNKHPEILDPLAVRELRAPVKQSLTVAVDTDSLNQIKAAAEENGMSFSALMRNIIFSGTRGGSK